MRLLTEKRYEAILKILMQKQSVTVTELTELLAASESTIRRDLNTLHNNGKLLKVYGGATSIDANYSSLEEDMLAKTSLHREDKIAIAKHAASLITLNEFVYIDAGTTTGAMLDFIAPSKTTFITNGPHHAIRLAARGFHVQIIGGQMKDSTSAIIGAEAIENLKKYNFTKGFFGVNAISLKAGYSTPDLSEGLVKSEAVAHCEKAYVLADNSKFNKVAPMTFAPLPYATIITTKLADRKYRDYTKIIEVHPS